MYITTQKASLINKAQLSTKSIEIQFFLLYLLWVFNSFKPEWTIPGLKFIAPVQTLIQLILLLLWIAYSNKKIDNPITKYFFYFLILMVVSTAFARNNGLGRDIIRGMFFFFITYLATITFANNEKRIFSIFNLFILGNFFIAVLSIKGGGMAHGVAIFQDQNDLALGMNILFSLTLFLGIGEAHRVKKILYFVLAAIFLAAIIISDSRGGFLGLVAILFFAWLKLPINKFKSTIVILVVIGGLLLLAPQSFWEEMSTIEQGSQDSTGGARIYFWKIAVREFLDNPIIGVGVMNYGVWLPDYVKPDDRLSDGSIIPTQIRTWGRVCHSIYFTLLSELGSIGVILFILILYQFYKELRFDKKPISLVRASKNVEEKNSFKQDQLIQKLQKCHSLSLGLMGSMIGFLVSGAFLSVLYYPQFWLLCSLGVTLGNCKKRFLKNIKIETEGITKKI